MGRQRGRTLELRTCRVHSCQQVSPGYGLLRVQPGTEVEARPGQFAMLEPQLRHATLHRPMSILASRRTVDFLIREVGPGSRALARVQPGDEVRMLAPLGNAFEPQTDGREILVGGGVGVSPLLFYATTVSSPSSKPGMIYGGRSAGDLVMLEDARQVTRLLAVTEDGSTGTRGMATDPLAQMLEREEVTRVLTCGPVPMMAATAKICERMDVPCVACLEAVMACGFGACLGCAVPSRAGGYIYVCDQGPVMEAGTVDWDRLLDMHG